ncbi:FIG00897933: hypothetical protein [Bacteroides ovatus]|uniref:hypothetical protein n=1 Tax=Bacteroides TaxID=816 RepID=UPI0011C14EA7|nr:MULTISPECIES: hypothetical protein [Bacteroides]MCS3176275.1 hypothetical protein [Candidatus Bacteroides intestinigallinarum]CAG9900881.1 FIG00897933: hypothetical protein [Bacteroides ovatus]
MCYKVLFFACGVLLLCMFGCSKDSVSENEMPTLTVDEASAISRKTAVISGSISVPEGTEIKSCGFLYSTVSSLPETDSKVVSVILKGLSNTYETTLTGLTPNTKYYYCLYASSGYTTTRSSIREFTTAIDGVPALEVSTSISVSETSLTLASKIVDDGGSSIQKFGFAYKETDSSDAEKLVEALDKTNDGRYTFTITGLIAEASYDVRAFATNAKGTGYGEKIILVTSAPETPILQAETKEPGSASIEISAKLMNDNDLTSSLTEVGFCWSKDQQEPTMDDSKVISQLNGKGFSSIVKELVSETTYYIRAYAINKRTKIGYSNVITFTTTKSAVPKLDVTTAVAIEETSVTLQSKILDNGGHDITKFGFAYKIGNNGTETLKEVPVLELKEDGTFQYTLTGFLPETVYEVRAFAVNSMGTGYGASCQVTTLEQKAPQVSLTMGDPGTHSVIATAVIQNAGGTSSIVREVGFCWSTSSTPTLIDDKIKAILDGISFNSNISGLKAETKYYIRAYAINEAKVGYSETIEIMTAVSNEPDVDDNVSPDK